MMKSADAYILMSACELSLGFYSPSQSPWEGGGQVFDAWAELSTPTENVCRSKVEVLLATLHV